jgi:acyl-CoA-dependent ceramide synthase
MLLHHVLTIALYAVAYMMNWVLSGTLVIICLNVADIFVAVGKAFSDTTFTKITYISAAVMLLSWFYTRIYCFSIIIYSSTYDIPMKTATFDGENEWTLMWFLRLFVILLLVLNIWWLYLLIRIIYKLLTQGKVEDIQSKIE